LVTDLLSRRQRAYRIAGHQLSKVS